MGFGSATKALATPPLLLNRSISVSRALDVLGRILIAALFVNALPGKMTNFSGTASFIASKGIPEPLSSALLVCAIVVLVFGSVLLVFGSNTILGASLLLIFLVPTTLIFHTNPLDLSHLFTNLAVIGDYAFDGWFGAKFSVLKSATPLNGCSLVSSGHALQSS